MCIIQENHLNEPFTDAVNQIIFLCASSVLLSLNKRTGGGEIEKIYYKTYANLIWHLENTYINHD